MRRRHLYNCPDCGVKPGEAHKDSCDVERCSSCGSQHIQCDESCDHDKYFARWTGIWPGSAEAEYLGISLNDFVYEELYKAFFVKPLLKES